MRPLLLTVALCLPAFGQWIDLGSNTILHLLGTHDVCPPNNYNGITFNFNTQCPDIFDAWGGAATDTKRNRLIFFGGGHVADIDNSLYALNLTPVGSETMTFLTRPGAVATAQTIETTDTPPQPVSVHSYDCVVYLPIADKVFLYNGIAYGGNATYPATWLADVSLSTPTWARMSDNTLGGGSVTGASCILDPTTADETVLVLDPVGAYHLNRYDVTTDTWSSLNSNMIAAGAIGVIGTAVVDPVRKLLFFVGNDGSAGSGTNRIFQISISLGSSYTPSSVYSSTTGCSGWVSGTWPGAVYDTSMHKIVGYPTGGGNTVYIFDPGSMTCVPQTFAAGPAAPNNTNGIFSRFAYFPSLGKYAVATNPGTDAFSLTLVPNGSPISGGFSMGGNIK